MFISAYKKLLKKLGSSNWWPGDTSFEIIAGAILTQNTSWKNVEKAIRSLKEHNLLKPKLMARLKQDELAPIIRSSGYYNQKARKLIAFLEWFEKFNYSISIINKKYRGRENDLRNDLLSLHGIGPETADSILCYAFEKPFFVVDKYTFRWLQRYRPDKYTDSYETLRKNVERAFKKQYPDDTTGHLNEYHALIVRLCNGVCVKRNPLCDECPLHGRCAVNIST